MNPTLRRIAYLGSLWLVLSCSQVAMGEANPPLPSGTFYWVVTRGDLAPANGPVVFGVHSEDGSVTELYTPDRISGGRIVWSPKVRDDGKLVFHTFTSSHTGGNLYWGKIGTPHPHALSSDYLDEPAGGVRWVPGTDVVLFSNKNSGIHRIDLDAATNDEVALTTNYFDEVVAVTESGKVFFDNSMYRLPPKAFTMNANGTGIQGWDLFGNNNTEAGDLSPDGTLILAIDRSSPGIWVAKPDKSWKSKIVDSGGVMDGYAAWGPDSKTVAFINSGNVWAIQTDRTGIVQLTHGEIPDPRVWSYYAGNRGEEGEGEGEDDCIGQPIGLWHLDGNLTDSADSHGGQAGAGTVTYVAGQSGQAGHFNGSTYFKVPDAADLSAMAEFSIELWVRLDAGAPANMPLVNKFGSGTYVDDEWILNVVGMKIHFGIYSGPYGGYNDTDLTGATTLATGRWYHVVVRFSNSRQTMEMFIDGQLDGARAAHHETLRDTGQQIQVGGFKYFGSDPWEYLRGDIDELIIWQGCAPVGAEGEGEGEEPCEYRTLFDAEWPLLAAYLGLNDNQIDTPGEGIPERWGLAMVRTVLCNEAHPWHTVALDAYTQNVAALEAEPGGVAALVAPFRHVAAALLMVNQNKQDRLKARLGLVNEYGIVRSHAKGPDELFGDLGDVDGDGATNLEEYLNVLAWGGGIEDFAYAASIATSWQGEQMPATVFYGLVGLVAALFLAGLCLIAGPRQRKPRSNG